MDFNPQQTAYNRANRTQTPDFAPGMGGTFDPFGSTPSGGSAPDPFSAPSQAPTPDPFGTPTSDPFATQSPNSDPFGGVGVVDPFGTSAPNPFGSTMGTSMTSIAGGMGMGGMQQTQPKAPEDRFFDALKAFGKGFASTTLDVVKSFGKNDIRFWNGFALRVAITGGVLAIISLIASIFGFSGLYPIIAGCLTAGGGFIFFMFSIEAASNYVPAVDVTPVQEPVIPAFEPSLTDDMGYEDDEEGWEDVDSGEVEEDTSWLHTVEQVDYDAILSSQTNVTPGMYTRQFLFEQFVQLLADTRYTPDYTNVVDYEEGDTEFLQFDEIITQASSVLGLKEEEYPILQGCSKNKFGFKLILTRPPKKVKIEDLAKEVAKGWAAMIYETDEDRAKVFFKADSILKNSCITLFSGESYLLSVMDIYAKEKAFMLDMNNAMPVVLGISETGKAYEVDMAKLESMIIAGMPRSGKTWTFKSILMQMVALNSPSRVQLAFIDPKDEAGDWTRFVTPHVKFFASRYRDGQGGVVNDGKMSIIDLLNWVTKVEGPRRRKLLGDAGVPNANDYRKLNPDKDLPSLYIVVDEMTTLSTMYKEDFEIYKNAINTIVTQFPNLDIKGLFIPHEVKDQIISKTAYASIKARISVNGNADHVEQTTGQKNFKYSLVNKGDMAMYIDKISAAVVYAKSAIITKENTDLDKKITVLGKLWAKWEPDSVKDSVMSGSMRSLNGSGGTSGSDGTDDAVQAMLDKKFTPKQEEVEKAEKEPVKKGASTKTGSSLEKKAEDAVSDFMSGFNDLF